MPDLAREIDRLRSERLRRLNDLHDDYDHTRKLWKMLRARVRRYGESVTFHNELTGSRVTGADLVGRTGGALRRLNEQTFKDIVAQFELFTTDLLRCWLTEHVALVEGKALDVRTLFASNSLQAVRDAALREAVESTILKRAYSRPSEWFRYLASVIGGPNPVSAQDAGAFAEMKATRDVPEHAAGVANASYREKAGAAARFAVGAVVTVEDSYHAIAFQLVRRLIDSVAAAAMAAA